MNITTTVTPLTASRLSPIALLLMAASLLIVAPQSTRASIETPFYGSFVTQFTTTFEFPLLYVTVNGKGNTTYMNTATASTDDQISNLIDGSGSATYKLTASDGDTLALALVVQPGGTLNVEGGVIFSGTYTVVGGTGRFRGYHWQWRIRRFSPLCQRNRRRWLVFPRRSTDNPLGNS